MDRARKLVLKLTGREFSVPSEFCKTRGLEKFALPSFDKLAVNNTCFRDFTDKRL
jgi:hypothetical protein